MTSIFLNSTRDDIDEIIQDLLRKKLGVKVIHIEEVKGGINSLARRALADNGKEYLVKQYLLYEGDRRNRFRTEFSGICFLWENGIRAIPEPVCLDEEHRTAVYAFIRGRKVEANELSEDDIYFASEFLGDLHALTTAKGADTQPIASEACFNVNAYIDCIENRLELFDMLPTKAIFREVRLYLNSEFMPVFKDIKKFVKLEAARQRISMNTELQKGEKTLSPSDFGFHNAIKCDGGSFVFIDFEYYGWDDPAKMIADFYLQPAVPVPYRYREIFFKSVHKYLGEDAALVKRLPLVHLVLSLKWCLIMLNPFLRSLSSKELDGQAYIAQLEKAKGKIEEAVSEFRAKTFPLSLL